MTHQIPDVGSWGLTSERADSEGHLRLLTRSSGGSQMELQNLGGVFNDFFLGLDPASSLTLLGNPLDTICIISLSSLTFWSTSEFSIIWQFN